MNHSGGLPCDELVAHGGRFDDFAAIQHVDRPIAQPDTSPLGQQAKLRLPALE